MDRSRRRGLRPLASVWLALLMLAATGSTASAATLIGDWKLKGSFRNATGTNLKLEAVGLPQFETVNVSGSVRKALVFDEAEGTKLTRVPRTARSSYSILISFELDDVDNYRRVLSWGTSLDDPALYVNDGHLDLYPYAETPTALLAANAWNRLLITRDGRSGLMKIYVNGRLRLAYVDYAGEFRLTDGTGHFFIDNGGENGSGTIANIRVWRGVVNA